MNRYKPAYATLRDVGSLLIRKSQGTLGENVSEIILELEQQWDSLQSNVNRKVQSLKDILEEWEHYTERMEDLMSWLRDAEQLVNTSLAVCTCEGLQEQLGKCQVRKHI